MLSVYLTDFSSLHELEHLNEPDQFVHYINYCVISQYCYDDVNVIDANVDGAHDLGLDGVFILVNGHSIVSIEDVDFFVDKLKRIDVEFLFIQSKTSNKFTSHEIGTFLSGVKQFFDSTTTSPINGEVKRYIEIKDYIYKRYSIRMNEAPICHCVYATTGRWVDDNALLGRVASDISAINTDGKFSDVKFKPFDSDAIKKLYRDLRKKIERKVDFDKCTIMPAIDDVTEAYIGIMQIEEFLKLIRNEDGGIIKTVFYDNVRDYQGNTQVNQEIEKTISDEVGCERFPVLNNGVTVVAQSITKIGTTFKINDYQIVNGCQTCHVIINTTNDNPRSFFVPVKLVVTDNQKVINEIIIATNRQTEVLTEAFESLSPFHQTLEDFYISHKNQSIKPLYYERRSKQYSFEDISPSQVVSLAIQTTTYVAMFLNQPQSTHRYYGELLRSYSGRMYDNEHSPYPYYIAALTNQIVQQYLIKGHDGKKRKYRPHILMLLRTNIAGEDIPPISGKKIDDYCSKIHAVLKDSSKIANEIERAISTLDVKIEHFKGTNSEWFRSRAFTETLLGKVEKRPTGVISYYNDFRGFGFIKSQQYENDVFLHCKDVKNYHNVFLSDGDKVEFDVITTQKGLQAKNVEIK